MRHGLATLFLGVSLALAYSLCKELLTTTSDKVFPTTSSDARTRCV